MSPGLAAIKLHNSEECCLISFYRVFSLPKVIKGNKTKKKRKGSASKTGIPFSQRGFSVLTCLKVLSFQMRRCLNKAFLTLKKKKKSKN